ncbi:MAG TPA: SDR family oxidoreductase [Candidatus Binataceae bacterium]|nr:SDR family oxidoreductase [Candidatus Binataceae bacterium]
MASTQSETGNWIRGKTCMITGATSGIGRASAIELGKLGAKLILVGRSRELGEKLVNEIRRAGNPDAVLLLADFESQAQIRKLAGALLSTGKPLHVLMNNAGVFNMKRKMTADGLEQVFAVNHLAYFMLTLLLLDRIKESAPARIINVSSDLHQRATINFDDLGGERSWGGMSSYAQSKLANILFTYELARRLEGTGVTVNAVHPGAVATNLARNNGLTTVAWKLAGAFMKSAETGARTQVYLASSPEVEGVTGKYFIDSREARSSAVSHDAGIARRLWEVSARMTGLPAA